MKISKTFFVALFAISAVAAAFTLTTNQKNKKMLLIFPKGSSYEKEWKKVDSLADNGLSKSALEVVNGIYTKAKSENNASQFVKAIIHRMRFEQQVEEYSVVKALNKLNEEAKESTYPVKPVLHSIIADLYWQFYQNNRWKFYNRTATTNFDNNDITTWDLKKLFSEVLKNYQQSLEQEDELKRTPLNIYDDILHKSYESRKYRPTLYDFLAHRAVDFYMNEEAGITQPAYKFELTSLNYFDDFDSFSKLKIESKDTLSSKYYALLILQKLIQLHATEGALSLTTEQRETALIDVDLKRLRFVKNKSVSEIKDSLYLQALQSLEKRFASNPASADVSFEIASVYFEKANLYKPLQSDEYKWLKKQAFELCDATIKKYPKSDGARNCEQLKAQIKERSLNFVTEKATAPNQPFRALLTYKNLKKVYVRIAKMDIEKYNKAVERYYGEELIKKYLQLTSVKEWEIELPDDGDYQQHSTEIKIPELQSGHYVVMIGSDKTFSYSNEGIAYANVWVSNISYINRRLANGSYDFYTLHRLTGAPLKGVTAQVYYEKYSYVLQKYEYIKAEKLVSDEFGHFNVQSSTEYRNINIDFTLNSTIKGEPTDRLQMDNNIYQYKNYTTPKRKETKTFFFIDRGIYRPGQTVYFKGIMINTDGETNEIMPKTPTTVTFYDVNHQKIVDLNVTTNEYGTFNGSFTTPAGVLNGQMSIENYSGSVYFSVEEYKRPKFEVSFNPVEGSYRLNEKIKVEGLAKAFSGAMIDGAEVKYRVVRNASFPSWWYWWRGYYPQSAQMEITNGVTKSNDTGSFFVD
ncbi:MAG: MG2 domain-containing protein, partial [Bacteroidia bacterium]